AFFVDAALLLFAAQSLLVLDALAGAALVVAAVAGVAAAREGAADHARGVMAALLLAPVRVARLAPACLLFADESFARTGARAVIVALSRLRATLGPLAHHALFVAACLLLPDLLLSGLLTPGLCALGLLALGLLSLCLLPGFGLPLPGALFAVAAFGLPAIGIAARFGLSALFAGALLRGLAPGIGLPALSVGAALGLLALFAGATFGLLARGLAAAGVLPVVLAAFRPLAPVVAGARPVVLLGRRDALAALVVAGGGRRGESHGQDRGERNRGRDLPGEAKFHFDHPRLSSQALAWHPLCASAMNGL